MMKVLVTVPWGEEIVASFRRDFPAISFTQTKDPDAVEKEIVDAEIVLGHLTPEEYAPAKRLRWIQYQGAGVDWIFNIPSLVESEVVVTCTKGAHAATIAEHTFGLIIAMARGFYSLFRGQERHVWIRPLEEPAVGLSGLTLGILGLGKIGIAVAGRARAFEMKVIAVDVANRETPSCVDDLWGLDGFHRLLRESDVLVVTIPLTSETRGMLGEDEFALMKRTAYLVAVSRGGIVDESALIRRLKGGLLAGAALDVQLQKPVPPDSPLWDTPRLIITPHCAGESRQTTENVVAICKDNLNRYLENRELLNVVDKKRGF